ncbi:MAG: hypothetical protein MK108_15780 [Mariniblastus sp.]|nr:hypothetical protein [Mariniblastus sp.]
MTDCLAFDCLAFDIGGANLKLASNRGFALHRPFPLWQSPQRLADQLAEMLAAQPAAERIGVTMTGELADCFESKQEGVRSIVETSRQVLGNDTHFYQLTGQFVHAAQAMEDWTQTAASNWHALASWVARQQTSGFLVDIGSTTVDLVPFENGVPCPRGSTDLQRLEQGELVYTGVGRSPVSCLLHSVALEGQAELPLAQELFATMQDVYLLEGRLSPDPANCQTADGRPFTVRAARQRIARLLCADPSELSAGQIGAITRSAAEVQRQRLVAALQQIVARHPDLPRQFVVAGQGEWLAREIIESTLPGMLPIHSVSELVADVATDSQSAETGKPADLADPAGRPSELSRCAPAYAVACLLGEPQYA